MQQLVRGDDDLIRAAIVAYIQNGGDPVGVIGPQVREHAGRRYVVLHAGWGVEAVYRVRTNGVLRCMKRWPAALND